MKVGQKKTNLTRLLIPLALLISVLLFSFQLTFDASGKTVKEKRKEIEKATILFNSSSIEEMISKGINQIHRDSICTMFINNQLGTPNLYYVYRDSLSPELMSDRTYLHIHLKDKSAWKEVGTRDFINLDFTRKLKELEIDNTTYYMQQAPLVHEYLDFDNIDFINTGRYKYRRGQSYNAKGIKVNIQSPREIAPNLTNIIIALKEKELNKVKAKRADALKMVY